MSRIAIVLVTTVNKGDAAVVGTEFDTLSKSYNNLPADGLTAVGGIFSKVSDAVGQVIGRGDDLHVQATVTVDGADTVTEGMTSKALYHSIVDVAVKGAVADLFALGEPAPVPAPAPDPAPVPDAPPAAA